MPPLPFSPVKFSGLIERVFAFDKRDKFPRFIPRPLNETLIVIFPYLKTADDMESIQNDKSGRFWLIATLIYGLRGLRLFCRSCIWLQFKIMAKARCLIARRLLAMAGLFLLTFSRISLGQGGPPLIGDDPGTPGNGKFEINIAYPFVQTESSTTMDAGYIDANYGLGDHIELSYQGGYLIGRNKGQGWKEGYDDSLVGLKWRFLDQETRGVDMSIYPQLGFNTTSSLARAGLAAKGLGVFLPIEIDKTIGKFEFDFEAGYQYSEHDRDQWAGGPILGYLLNDRVELLAEARFNFEQNFHSTDLILDGGARINLIKHVQLLFATGRGIRNNDGSPHFYLYAGFGFTF